MALAVTFSYWQPSHRVLPIELLCTIKSLIALLKWYLTDERWRVVSCLYVYSHTTYCIIYWGSYFHTYLHLKHYLRPTTSYQTYKVSWVITFLVMKVNLSKALESKNSFGVCIYNVKFSKKHLQSYILYYLNVSHYYWNARLHKFRIYSTNNEDNSHCRILFISEFSFRWVSSENRGEEKVNCYL